MVLMERIEQRRTKRVLTGKGRVVMDEIETRTEIDCLLLKPGILSQYASLTEGVAAKKREGKLKFASFRDVTSYPNRKLGVKDTN